MDSPFLNFYGFLETMERARIDELHRQLVKCVEDTRSAWQADERLHIELKAKKTISAYQPRFVIAVGANALTALSRYLSACTNLRAFEEMAQLPDEKRHRHLYQ